MGAGNNDTGGDAVSDESDWGETGDYCRTCFSSNIGCLDCAAERNAVANPGFTRKDVEFLNARARDDEENAYRMGAISYVSRCRALAARISALLPPEETR
jgi:hypothetical protein